MLFQQQQVQVVFRKALKCQDAPNSRRILLHITASAKIGIVSSLQAYADEHCLTSFQACFHTCMTVHSLSCKLAVTEACMPALEFSLLQNTLWHAGMCKLEHCPEVPALSRGTSSCLVPAFSQKQHVLIRLSSEKLRQLLSLRHNRATATSRRVFSCTHNNCAVSAC